ncbi:hypothetical protein QVD17_35860 [Tagetes erecta]|uniref:non-specific serine/threonine protein kinase n=1 Tax=Tagetes erecta TaxID=13708 RepID=A0AAD8JTL6_TARER|nr:hypothetical protein QVD17_35860 [Tagetes erecta]
MLFMTYLSIFIHAITLLICPATLAKNHTDHLALLAIKSTITLDPQNVLGSWNASLHYCQWQGVTCGRRHPRVTELDLGSRGIVGSLPPHIGNLSFLRVIWLENNTFKGVIPPQLGGVPSFLANLTSLRVISAHYNRLSGEIPLALGNQISGDLPKDIGLKLPNLENFEIEGNKFTGTIPFSFSNCSNLVELSLSENGFTGKININFSKMSSISILVLDGNNLGSSQPDEMHFIDSMINCSKLEVLIVGANKLRGILPSSVGNLSSQITTLSFEQNSIYGTLPSGIGNLLKLERLYIGFNEITGRIPSELGYLGNLKHLYVDHNSLNGTFPDFVGNLSQLEELMLSDNRLEGQIPPNLGNCTRLVSLNLSGNNLTHQIPIELFQLSSMTTVLDLSSNNLVGPLPQDIGKLKSLSTLDLSQNHLVGAIPNTIGRCSSLEYLDMKANSFEGPIPLTMNALRGIRKVDLSKNNLSGQIPRFLEQLNLSSLNLSFNNLEGEVPMRGIFKNTSAFSIIGNNRLCGGLPVLGLPKCVMSSRSKKDSHISHVILVVIPICSLLIIAMVLTLLFCWRRRKTQTLSTGDSFIQPFSMVSYGSILKATNGFSEQNLIGSGTFSKVYKGILEADGAMVAIKILKLENQGALKSFMAECEALKNIRHRNLVKIITSCSSIDFQGNDFKALIYEFMSNGNLEKWLHPSSNQETEIQGNAPHRLSLSKRLSIATDVAHAIHYLHQECEVPILHCDLKPSNILLDNDMVAHIGDFGLAKFLPLKPHQSSSIGIRGTTGYAAPEYGVGNEMTKEGDIYSFGILLLEMITGRRPTDPIFQEGLNLHGYVQMVLPDRLMEIIEPMLVSTYMEVANGYSRDEGRKLKRLEEGMIALTRIGLACSMESPRERMNTTNMLRELHRINKILQKI